MNHVVQNNNNNNNNTNNNNNNFMNHVTTKINTNMLYVKPEFKDKYIQVYLHITRVKINVSTKYEQSSKLKIAVVVKERGEGK